MDKIKKSRRVTRGLFTKHSANITKLLDEKKFVEAEGPFQMLEEYLFKLQDEDEKIFDFMLDGEATEKELIEEATSTDVYRSKFKEMKVRFEKMHSLNKINNIDTVSVHSTSANYTTKLRLPKIEFQKFGGDLKEWLQFWNQFQRIHDDESIASIDKFYYLIQATVPGSRARRVVESFPATKENYPLVIEALSERFGREDLLIEVYVRDLISLTLPSNRQNRSVTEIYDKLTCRLRALDTLGVTKGKCAAILCPLLESCMSEDFLRAWQRKSSSLHLSTPDDRLDQFITFMKSEVQGEERIKIAKSCFGMSGDNEKKITKVPSKPNVSTATGLLSVASYKQFNCIFCNDSHHYSADCYTARDMTLSDRIEVIKSKRCCIVCTKPHRSRFCKFYKKCAVCDGRHVILLCPELKRHKQENYVSETAKGETSFVSDSDLANLTPDVSVLIPTLMVRLRGDGIQKTVRVVLDTGSQHSYVLKRTAQEMGYKPIGEEAVVHSLFSGQKTGVCVHKRYRLYLSSPNDEYQCNFEVLDQDSICDNLPQIQKGEWIHELRDVGLSPDSFLNEYGPVEILIGADIASKLLTGSLRKLPCGLTALETFLGWSLLGKMPIQAPRTSTAMLVTPMMINDLDIPDHRKLESLEITDMEKRESKRQREEDRISQGTIETLLKSFCVDNASVSNLDDEEHLKKSKALKNEFKFDLKRWESKKNWQGEVHGNVENWFIKWCNEVSLLPIAESLKRLPSISPPDCNNRLPHYSSKSTHSHKPR